MPRFNAHPRAGQTGGVTILVALMMLVLLTLAAVGMSRNAFKEVVSSGFSRQGALARNVADSGLEWSLFWLHPPNTVAPTGTAATFAATKANISKSPSLAGITTDALSGGIYAPGGTPQGDMFLLNPPSGVTEGFTMGLTIMGTPSVYLSSPSSKSKAAGLNNSGNPTIWAVRSDAQVQQGGVTFTHGVEGWISVPASQN